MPSPPDTLIPPAPDVPLAAPEQAVDKWFDTRHLKGDLKNRSVQGGFNTIGGQAVSFLMNICSTVILARLLPPDDYGLVAMVTAITGFITIFKDLGLSAAIVQREKIDQQQVSSVFWLNLLISFGIAVVVALLAPVLVYFYQEERLFSITLVFAGSIFITGLSLQHNALMQRQMKFAVLSLIQIASTAGSLLTGILLAWGGYGYWALVATMVLTPVFSTIALWSVCSWRPSVARQSPDLGSFLKFGAGITGFDLVNYFSRNMDNVLIGKFIGAAALGLYSKSYQLLMLPITQLRNPLNAVALPVLSSLQTEKEKFRSYYQRYLFTLAFFSMPLVVGLGVYSEELILLVLGEQWAAAAYIFKLLAISAFIQPIAGTQGLILITTGQVRRYFLYGIYNAICITAGFAVGIYWGVAGVAIAYAIVTYLLLFPLLRFCLKGSPVSVSSFFREIAFPGVFSLLSGAAMLVCKIYLGHLPSLLLCLVGAFTGATVYILLWQSTRTSRERFQQILEIKTMLFKRIIKK
ncbi:lipopolysaccharide biosynthesis protein [Rufibacter immobilis]|uniref:lipopolysaccharide biosynthesis protein n=1 Tax=Rufibacter immobilis TaxID=1348778 RepID=UPI0035E97780